MFRSLTPFMAVNAALRLWFKGQLKPLMPADPKYRCSQVLGSSSGSGPCSLARRTSARQDHANTICRHHGFRLGQPWRQSAFTPRIRNAKQLHVRWNCCWLSSGTCRARLASSGPFPFSLSPFCLSGPQCALLFSG